MASSTSIANLALSHLGISKTIASLTERSQEALAINAFYDTAVEELQREFPWPFNTRFGVLSLVEEDPTSEWSYSYRYPSTAIFFRRIFGLRVDSRQSEVKYRIASDDTGKLILTDEEEPEGEWSVLVTEAGKFTADFALALSFRLAAYAAPRLTAGDPFKMGNRSLELYMLSIEKAQGTAAKEEKTEEIVESEFIRERG
jgi:hypothetical protein